MPLDPHRHLTLVRPPLSAAVEFSRWPRPPIFNLIQSLGNVPEPDMRRTFNLGIGLIAVVGPQEAGPVVEAWRNLGESPVVIGEVTRT